MDRRAQAHPAPESGVEGLLIYDLRPVDPITIAIFVAIIAAVIAAVLVPVIWFFVMVAADERD